MLRFLFWTVVFSIGSIYLANHIWEHFKDKYVAKQTKNLVDIQTHKYKQIAEDLAKQLQNNQNNIPIAHLPNNNPYLTQEEKEWMICQLSEFMESKN